MVFRAILLVGIFYKIITILFIWFEGVYFSSRHDTYYNILIHKTHFYPEILKMWTVLRIDVLFKPSAYLLLKELYAKHWKLECTNYKAYEKWKSCAYFFFSGKHEGSNFHSCWPGWLSDGQFLLGTVLPGTWHPTRWYNAYRYRGLYGRLLQHFLLWNQLRKTRPPSLVCWLRA